MALADAMKAAEELEPLMTSGTGGADDNGQHGGGSADGQPSGGGNTLQDQLEQMSVCLKFEIRCPLSLYLIFLYSIYIDREIFTLLSLSFIRLKLFCNSLSLSNFFVCAVYIDREIHSLFCRFPLFV